MARLTGDTIRVVGAGRTDAGVHALGQVVHFDTRCPIPVERLPQALNALLPRDLRVRRAMEVGPTFHARFSALSRVYRYAVVGDVLPSPLLERYALRLETMPDLSRMREAAGLFLGEHDFRGYALSGGYQTSRRIVHRVEVQRNRKLLLITIEANAFLRGMVRYLVSAMLEYGLGRVRLEDLQEVLATGRRPARWTPAPPQGLCLVKVRYPDPWD